MQGQQLEKKRNFNKVYEGNSKENLYLFIVNGGKAKKLIKDNPLSLMNFLFLRENSGGSKILVEKRSKGQLYFHI